VSEDVAKYKVGSPARVGLVAPIDVVVPPGNTGLDSSQTSFFQFAIGVSMVTSLSLSISYPTLATTPADITYVEPTAAKEQKKAEGLPQSRFLPLRDIF
ncbi:hypothetical protein RYX36_007522, partial [Vicia faba]